MADNVTVRRTETRQVSGWGKLWRWCLGLWVVFAAYDMVSMMSRFDEVRRTKDAAKTVVGAMVVNNIAHQKLVSSLLFYGAGAAVLLVLIFATRSRVVVIEERVTTPPRQPERHG